MFLAHKDSHGTGNIPTEHIKCENVSCMDMKDIRFVNLMTSGSVISEVSSLKSFIQVKILPVSWSTGVSFTVRQENQ